MSNIEVNEKTLRAYEHVGKMLWPFVKHFGLFGAEPQAVEAVRMLGVLIGEIDENTEIAAARDAGASMILREIADVIENDKKMRGRLAASGARFVAEFLRRRAEGEE